LTIKLKPAAVMFVYCVSVFIFVTHLFVEWTIRCVNNRPTLRCYHHSTCHWCRHHLAIQCCDLWDHWVFRIVYHQL